MPLYDHYIDILKALKKFALKRSPFDLSTDRFLFLILSLTADPF